MSPVATSNARAALKSKPSCRTADLLVLASALIALAVGATAASLHMSLAANPHVLGFALFDAVLVLYATAALGTLQRRPALGAALALLLANLPLAAAAIKFTVLGEPGGFGDLLLLPDLFRVIDPRLAGAGIAGLVVLGLGFVSNGRAPTSVREAAVLAPLAIAVTVMAAVVAWPAVAAVAASSLPVQGQSFPTLGHFYTAYANFVRAADWDHTVRHLRADSALKPGAVTLRTAELGTLTPRNVHLLMIESLTDPAWYPRFDLAEQPLPDLFERWRRGPHGTAFSPVFGNRSSNAEFELLCGVPAAVGPSEVVFWRLAERPLACLPNRFADRGYRSVALHPSPPRTFNLSKAYPALGFEDSAFATDLDMRDRDGQFLAAAATLEQHWQRVRPLIGGAAPVLSYAFVNASHFPYERNLERRPNRLQPTGASPLITGYLNAIYDVSEAIDGFVDRVLAADPDSLIVVVGDHAPALGPNFEGFRSGGRIPADAPDPLAQAIMYEVPLLVIDRGILVPTGRMPTYLIPYLLLDRLSAGAFCREHDCAWQDGPRLRPFAGFALQIEAEGSGAELCRVADPRPPAACAAAAEATLIWQVELLNLLEGTVPPALPIAQARPPARRM